MKLVRIPGLYLTPENNFVLILYAEEIIGVSLRHFETMPDSTIAEGEVREGSWVVVDNQSDVYRFYRKGKCYGSANLADIEDPNNFTSACIAKTLAQASWPEQWGPLAEKATAFPVMPFVDTTNQIQA